MTRSAPRPHDLLRVRTSRAYFRLEREAEAAFQYLQRDALVVVRRAEDMNGRLAVGIRGDARAERYAAWMDPAAIIAVIRPCDLVQVAPSRVVSAFQALTLIKARWSALAYAWGPTGSVAFELASGRAMVIATSDLDILLTVNEAITREDAALLLRSTAGMPCCVDVQVETAVGAFSLEEFAQTSADVILRTSAGPVLTSAPWHYRGTV